jgi:hypothetical protein
MEILFPLLLAGGFLWWVLWLTLRAEDRKDASKKTEGASGPDP